MNTCGWCGKDIMGDSCFTIEGPITRDAIVVKVDIQIPPTECCCSGCAWALAAELHRLVGFSGKELRKHLIDLDGLVHPPGKPAGSMRKDCVAVDVAEMLVSAFEDRLG